MEERERERERERESHRALRQSLGPKHLCSSLRFLHKALRDHPREDDVLAADAAAVAVR